jgi:two-component system response regulator HydG
MMESVGSRMSDEGAVLRGTVSMNILIVDDEPSIRETCAEVARQAGMKAIAVASAEEALEVLENSAVDIVLTDLMLQQTNGLDLLRRVHDTSPTLPVIVLTQYGTIDSAVAATRLGAVDYVTKPFRIEELRSRLERAARAVELQQENYLLREQLRTRPGFGGLIGVSERMQRVYKIVQKVSLHEYPVLILGESGTGKELVAKSVHFSGPRKDRPFVPVDCSSLVPTLIESELFGYVKGAFTGALHGKQGLLEAANGGTLFLDEIGDMPVDLQAKLLRALQEREVKPVGATERRRIDVRIIAATNRDLDSAIKTGAFRQDLYFRLNVVQVKLPPLRERKSDIPLLVISFLEKFSSSQQTSRDISEDANAPVDRLRLAGKCPRAGKRDRARRRARLRPDCPCGGFAEQSAIPENGAPPGEERTGAPRGARAPGHFAHSARNRRRQARGCAYSGHRQDDALPEAEAVPHGSGRQHLEGL